MLVADGWDDCIVGFAEVDGVPRVIYSRDKMIRQMMEDGASYEEADEHISFNVEGAFVGLQGQHPLLLQEVEGRDELDEVADLYRDRDN